MKESLRNLIELQKVDNELQALEDLLGDLPQKVEKLEADLDGLKAEVAEKQTQLEALLHTRRRLEGEEDLLHEKRKKYEEQLYAVTSNREYDAITLEIDETKAKLDEVETRLLESMQQEEQLKGDLESLKAQIESYEADLTQKRAELEEKTRATESEYRLWEAKRQQLASRLSRPVLYQYERIRSVRRDTAVVSVNKYACGGCFAAIPPQKVMEIRTMTQLITCESCGRILVYENQNVTV